MSRLGVLTLNFGEPDAPTLEKVIPFLERIFLDNGSLEALSPDARRERARQLAERRAPGLLEEYRQIGGSPMNAQADLRARALEAELRTRGYDVVVYSAFQYTEPFISRGVARARADGVERLVALPVYPMCGISTTVKALDAVGAALEESGWDVPVVSISGWHHHPDYLALRATHIRDFLVREGLELSDPDTLLYFSAHGTPLKYLEEGSRYDRYVDEQCRSLAEALGAPKFAVGFQNHGHRGVPWTEPENEDRIREVSETHLVVDAVSFVHEQSETLAELDHELRDFARGEGKVLHRVPVPHDLEGFPRFLATLVEEALRAAEGAGTSLARCRCRPGVRTWCTNGARDLPASPFNPAMAAEVWR